jgi:hypothetical protein
MLARVHAARSKADAAIETTRRLPLVVTGAADG